MSETQLHNYSVIDTDVIIVNLLITLSSTITLDESGKQSARLTLTGNFTVEELYDYENTGMLDSIRKGNDKEPYEICIYMQLYKHVNLG